jgi:hypothetical protein
LRHALILLALLAAAPALADVRIDSRLTIESVAGGGSGSVSSATCGLKRREERRLALEGPFASAQPETVQSTITRLDRAVLDRLFAADSTYEEVPLARLLAQLHKGTLGAIPGVDPKAALDLAWTVESSRPEGAATIAGYAATPSAITLRGKGTQRATGQPIELVLKLELWTAKDVPGAAELRAFDAKYAAAVGMAPGAIEETMGSFGVPRAALQKVTAARARIVGTPLRTVMTVAMPSLGDLMKRLSATMPGVFGDAPPAADGPLITSTLEVERIDTAGIDPARFRVPAGFRRRSP